MKAFIVLAIWLAAILAGGAVAQVAPARYPERPVRVIVPYAAGGPTDVIARTIAQQLSERLGQTFYVENIPGAGASLGTLEAAKSAPDGHTLLFVTNDLAARPALVAHPPYDPVNGFVAVALVAQSPEVVVIHPSVPAKSLKELVAQLAAGPAGGSYASPGVGTTTHISAMRLFKLRLGLDLVPVPFQGGGPAILSTLAGHTPIAFTALAAAAPYLKDGLLRPLAVTSGMRSSSFPDIPTLAEAGYPGLESDVTVGLVVAAATPQSIVGLLHSQIEQILGHPEVKERLAGLGFDINVSSQQAFAARIKAEFAMWSNLARDAHIKLE